MRLLFRMADGTDLLDEDPGHQSLVDEVAFERHFKMSSAVIATAHFRAVEHAEAVTAAVQAGEDPPEPDAGTFPHTEWLIFFAWRRLRRANPGAVAAKFDLFLEQIAEMVPVEEPEEDAAPPDDREGLEAAVVEATGGSGLDPTAPGRPRTRQRPSS